MTEPTAYVRFQFLKGAIKSSVETPQKDMLMGISIP